MTTEWIYFLSGALVPIIAYWLLLFRQPLHKNQKMQEKVDRRAANFGMDNNSTSPQKKTESSSDAVAAANTKNYRWGAAHAPYKMMLVVNKELSMGPGKIAAQCAHAALGCYQAAQRQCPEALRIWEYSGCTKIALACPSLDALEYVAVIAQSRNIPYYLVEDAGRTQIAAGSRTVLGLFGPASELNDGVTNHLKLL